MLEQEGLQANAHRVGEHLMAGLGGLIVHHAAIGDVRGLGLFIGVELFVDRETRRPAGYVANRMREHGVRINTDGRGHNVLKIKPPVVFTEADADFLLATLDRVLAEDYVREAALT
jgi:4-aminobutyrate aminotransferase-like enzyme